MHAILAGAMLLVLGSFLPWVSFADLSINGFMGELGGNPEVLIIAFGLLGGVFGMVAQKWSLGSIILLGLLAAVWTIKQILELDQSKLGEASIGIGIIAILIGSLVLIGGAFKGFSELRTRSVG